MKIMLIVLSLSLMFLLAVIAWQLNHKKTETVCNHPFEAGYPYNPRIDSATGQVTVDVNYCEHYPCYIPTIYNADGSIRITVCDSSGHTLYYTEPICYN